MQLFIDGAAHLIELGAVIRLQGLQPLVHGGAHFHQAALVDLDQALQLFAEARRKAGQ
ncbi:hypothetical protein D3C81_2272990 [compost metagenome]